MRDRLAQILEFLETIETFKAIERSTYLSDHSRHESDSDHTWHMAMFALLLHGELDIEVDIIRVLILIMVHDLCEIYTGDTFAHSPQHGDHEREWEAVKKLFAILPEDLQNRLLNNWHEFTFGVTPEARFARALDRLQALAQNAFSAGRTWSEHGVTETMSRELNREAMDFDPELSKVFEHLYHRADVEGLWPS
jgi:putative hydrolase of HD superfamily